MAGPEDDDWMHNPDSNKDLNVSTATSHWSLPDKM